MPQGTVKWFKSEKGFGFITGDDGQDYFAHFKNIQGDGFKKLDAGDKVDFEVQSMEKGPAAINIRKI